MLARHSRTRPSSHRLRFFYGTVTSQIGCGAKLLQNLHERQGNRCCKFLLTSKSITVSRVFAGQKRAWLPLGRVSATQNICNGKGC
jgi:hypothetical protein